ncbi:MAG: hypothetical protein ACW96X_12775, partial [Promethearchaeota archaeon]
IIYSFNDDLTNLDGVFEDLRLWSDIDYSTNEDEIKQPQYDPNFPLFNWNPLHNEQSYISTPGKISISPSFYNSFPIDWNYALDNFRAYFYDYSPSLTEIPNEKIFISKLQPRFYFRYADGYDVIGYYKFSNGGYCKIYFDNPIYDSNGEWATQYGTLETKFDTSFEDLDFYNYGDYQGPLGNSIPYTDNLGFVDDSQGATLLYIGLAPDYPYDDLNVDIMYFDYNVYYTDEPNTFEDYIYAKKFDIPTKNLTEFYILDNTNNKRMISNTTNFNSSGSSVKSLLNDPDLDFEDIIYKTSFGSNTLSFNIKANINYPDFANDVETITATNVINNFQVVPKLQPNEGKGLQQTTYPYQSSWWHQQEFTLPLPFNLTFNDLASQNINQLSEINFDVMFNVSLLNFNNFSWRPNLKIFDPEINEWLPYIGYIISGNDILWDWKNDYNSNDYDKIQLNHDHSKYLQVTNGSSQNNEISFSISRDSYPNISNLFRSSTDSAYLTFLCEIYVIPGIYDNGWNLDFEALTLPFKRRGINTSLTLKNAFTRRFRTTDVFKKKIVNSNNFYNGQPLVVNSNTYIDLNSLFGDNLANDIASICTVFGIKQDSSLIVPLDNNEWNFDINNGFLHLSNDVLLKFDHFNFTMELWTDFIPIGGNKFEPDKNSFDYVTLIEKVIGVREDGSIQWFSKVFEKGTMFYASDEPYYIHLTSIDSIDYISFASHINLTEFTKIRGVVHDIGVF